MWNVGIDARKVVSNDLHMDSANGIRTLIITGPNAGGKSVYILGIGANAVLHQAFGIVAAQSDEDIACNPRRGVVAFYTDTYFAL